MNARRILPTGLALLLIAAGTSHAQSGFYGADGSNSSGFAPYAGAGYSYKAPSYGIGRTSTSYRVGGSPAYLYTTRPPRLNHIQPGYQSAYRYDRGGPSFGGTSYYGNYGISPLSTYRGLSYPSLAPLAGYRGTHFSRLVYRPYVTVSQYVYTPTYYGPTYWPQSAPYGAVYGAYGYSTFYGY